MEEGESLKRARNRVSRACVQCKKSHTACDDYRPCHRCVHLGKSDSCRDAEVKRRGRPPKKHRGSGEGGNTEDDSDSSDEKTTKQEDVKANVRRPRSPTRDGEDGFQNPTPNRTISFTHFKKPANLPTPSSAFQSSSSRTPTSNDNNSNLNSPSNSQFPPHVSPSRTPMSTMSHTPYEVNPYSHYSSNILPPPKYPSAPTYTFPNTSYPQQFNSYHPYYPQIANSSHISSRLNDPNSPNTQSNIDVPNPNTITNPNPNALINLPPDSQFPPFSSGITNNSNPASNQNKFVSVFTHMVDEVKELKQLSKNLIQDQQVLRTGMRQINMKPPSSPSSDLHVNPSTSFPSSSSSTKVKNDPSMFLAEYLSVIKSERGRILFQEAITTYTRENKPFAILRCSVPGYPEMSIIVAVNDAFCKALGYSCFAELVGCLHTDVIHSQRDGACGEIVKSALEKQVVAGSPVSEVVQLNPLLKMKNAEVLDARTTFQLFSKQTDFPTMGVMTIESSEQYMDIYSFDG
eukprot:TRINITY_DN5418_c0_g1_i2.p1 TRINITY_DN5418_c0_g1~~TRINITY_DN5418_c0_g1_i2.p1  ORF type:complete len:516 (-),score=95.58 TRINITY_DN5418_c0_g1_i2:483-2030(-)